MNPRRNEGLHCLVHNSWDTYIESKRLGNISSTFQYSRSSCSGSSGWTNKQTNKNIFCLWLCLGRNSQESISKLYRHENFLPRIYNSQALWLVAVWIPKSEIKTMHRLINSVCYFFLNLWKNDLLWSISRDKLPRGYSNFCSNTFSQLRPSSHTHPWDSGLPFVIYLFTTCWLIPLINLLKETIFLSPRRNIISNPTLIIDAKLMTTESSRLSIREIIH